MASVAQEIIAPTVSAEDLTTLQDAVVGFDREQLIWTSGFLAGLAGAARPAEQIPAAVPITAPETSTWTVFYATETGNSRRIADKLAEQSKQAGLSVNVVNLREFRPRGLSKIENAMFVIATHGIGEPPEGSELFFDYLSSDKAPRLENLNYSVLALGDSSYADFCEIGKVLDERLQQLGATAVVERVDCDLDFDNPAAAWSTRVVDYARENSTAVELPRTAHLKSVDSVTSIASSVSRDKPFNAEILTQQKITGRDSTKDVRHIELDLEGSGMSYLPGDSLGVITKNPPQLVDALLQPLNFKGDENIVINGSQTNLRDALLNEKEITILSRPLLDATAVTQPRLKSILEHRERFTDYLKTRQLIDLVHEFPIERQAQEFVDTLRGLTPRLYSIASSPDANPDEAHLTVAVVDYKKFGRQHWGSASNFLVGDTARAPIYVEANDRFRLPTDGNTPIIMIGAGTGVAPYRAFIEHRQEHGHTGDNWLLFGDRNFSSDFLYQLEWLRYRKDGILSKLNVAFSRDQDRKIYVQQRLAQNSSSVFRWLERGAHIYVCGDAEYMAADVHVALQGIVQEEGGLTEDRATEYLNELKQSNRYQRDVY